jgi:hypothetical protein
LYAFVCTVLLRDVVIVTTEIKDMRAILVYIFSDSTNEISDITFRTDNVRPSKEYNSSGKTKSRTYSRWNSELPKELAITC